MKDIAGREVRIGDLVVYWRHNGAYSHNSLLGSGYGLVIGEGRLWIEYNMIVTDISGCYLCSMVDLEIKKKEKMSLAYNAYITKKICNEREASKFVEPGMYGMVKRDLRDGTVEFDVIFYLGKVKTYWEMMSEFDDEELEELTDIYKEGGYAYLYFYGKRENIEGLISEQDTKVFDVKSFVEKYAKEPYIDDVSGELSRRYSTLEVLVYKEPIKKLDKCLGQCEFMNWKIGDKLRIGQVSDIVITRIG